MEMNKIAGLLVTALVLFCGCKKYLAVKSDNSLVTPTTLNDLQSLLDDALYMNYSTPSFGAVSSDDYFISDDTYQSLNPLKQHVYRWSPYEYRYPSDWGDAYQAVYSANLCLERVALITPSLNETAQWNEVKGAALLYRSWYFAELSWLFSKAWDAAAAASDPGIVLRYGTDFNVPSVRSTVKDCYDRIIADTREAVLYLPDYPQQLTRPSKGAAYGLLSRVYLSMRLYDSAGYYASLALELTSSLMDYNDPAAVDVNADNPFAKFNAETVFYTTMIYTPLEMYHPVYGNALVDTVLYSSYEGNDLRRTAFFTASGNYQQFKGNYAADYRLFSGIATDELLLTRAECFARTGNVTAALEDINLLLSKRMLAGSFIPVTAGTREAVLAVILKERRKELLFRGSLRWMDIKRLNKENANISMERSVNGEHFTLPPNDKRYALQLPADVIETSGMQQN